KASPKTRDLDETFVEASKGHNSGHVGRQAADGWCSVDPHGRVDVWRPVLKHSTAAIVIGLVPGAIDSSETCPAVRAGPTPHACPVGPRRPRAGDRRRSDPRRRPHPANNGRSYTPAGHEPRSNVRKTVVLRPHRGTLCGVVASAEPQASHASASAGK